MDTDDTFTFEHAPQSSILRHRRRKADKIARKGLKVKPVGGRGGRRRVFAVLFTRYLPPLAAFLGLQRLQPDVPLTPQQRRSRRLNALICAFLFVLTLATRFYRLAAPAKIVFDEFHFAEFVDDYIRGSYLFDIHPPLGKLTLAAVAYLAGYQPKNYVFDALGKPYGDLMYYPQRAFSALLGSFIPPVMYLTCRALSLSTPVSLAAAAMPMFDLLLCVESRLILTDAQLILYAQLALLCALYLWKTPKHTPRRYFWLVCTAVWGACAASTKWTAIVAPGLIGIVSLTGAVFPTEGSLELIEMGLAGAIAIGIYTTTFWIHFKLLPRTGKGDAFMPLDFQRTLIGNKYYDPRVSPAPSFVDNFRYLNWEMLRANSAIQERHPWESKWYEWLYNARGVLYLDDPVDNGLREQIYLIMNPVLTIASTLGVVCSVGLLLSAVSQLIRSRRRRTSEDKAARDVMRKRAATIAFFLAGWVLNLLPYVGVQRCTFLYHVLPALQMATILTAIALEQLPTRFKFRQVVCILIIAAMGGAFYHWRPWVYGLHRSSEELDKLRLMPRWN